MLTTDVIQEFLKNLPRERFAIAFSGGGDSAALVHLCRNISPKPLILIVDHGLRNGSDVEAKSADVFARELGLESRILTWKHDNPRTGLQEKARRARYGLMGRICRETNIRYLLTAHNQDDQAETLLMRYEKRTGWRGAAGMGARVYAPVWPELATITVLRPLLEMSREDLRDYNRQHGVEWIEDPSNQNLVFERVRARQYLSARPIVANHLLTDARVLREGIETEKRILWRYFENRVRIDENGLATLSGSIPKKAWEYLLLAAGGGDKPISETKLGRIQELSALPTFKGLTLGGARIVSQKDKFLIGPDPGPYTGRNHVSPISERILKPGESTIWGGRFKITAQDDPIVIKTIQNMAGKAHTTFEKNHLKTTIKPTESGKGRFTMAMPFIFDESGRLLSSIFENRDAGYFHSLVENRLQGFLRI